MYETRMVRVGDLTLGGHNPVWVQSMTNTDTRDAQATLVQIRALAKAGCDIVRVSVYDEDCARAVRTLVDGSPVPLVADIHFNHRLAIAAAENGIHKLRINPGNIGGEAHVRELAAAAKAHHIPIRIGVNTGSIEKDILAKYGQPCAEGLVESALNHARMLEKVGFEDIVLSMKASDVRLTIAAYELAAKRCDYPLHVGVTEAGLPGQGTIKSAIGIGALLAGGIGNTIRVSLTGDPVPEAKAAWDILRALNLRTHGVQLVSCPTCGRTCIDVAGIAARVEKELSDIQVPLKVAVMGCVVNGPGEAREADIGMAGGKRGGVYTAPWSKAAVQGADKIHSSPTGGEFIIDKYYLRGTAESVLVANAEVVLRSMTVLLLKPDGSRPVRELLPGGGYEKAVVEEPRNDCTDSGGGLSKCNYNGSLVRPAVLRQLPAKLLHESNGALRVAREMLALPGVDQDIVAQWIILTFREEQM